MDAWSTAGVAPGEAGECVRLGRTQDRGHEVLAAEGDEFERTGGAPVGAMAWSERGLVRRSPRHADHQATGWEKRLRQAATHLTALTPPRGRGTRQSTDDAPLGEAMDRVRTEPRVAGLLNVTREKPVEQTPPDVGRGRGAVRRAPRVIQKTRDDIPHLARQADPSAARSQRLGGKAVVTQAGLKRRSLHDAVLGSRPDDRVERIFNRLKRHGHIAPLWGKLNAQIAGLTYLLTRGVRV